MSHKESLKNGLQIVSEQIPYLRSICIGVWIKTGTINETPSTNGLSHLLEHLFFKGTKNRSAKEIMEVLECVGGTSNAFTGREYTCLYAKVLDTHLDLAIDLLSDLILNSTFQDIEKEKQIIIQEVQSYIDSPEDYIFDLFTEAFWHGHPLGLPISGTTEAVVKLNVSDILAYYKKWYVPDNMIISLAGNFEPKKACQLIAQFFERLEGPAPAKTLTAPVITPKVNCQYRDIGQVHFCLGTVGVPASDDRRFAFNLLGNILGGSPISRLFQKVREQEGLAYQINSFMNSLENASLFGVYAATSPENTQKVIDLTWEELKDLKENPISPKELGDAKEQLKGNITLSLESSSNRMIRLARSQLTLGRVESLDEIWAHIDGVQTEDLQAFAREIFDDRYVTLATLGPLNEVTMKPL